MWERHPLQICYQSWKAEKFRRIEPLVIVLKSGAWYVVGRVGADIHIYRISRILELSMLNETFEHPAVFNLAANRPAIRWAAIAPLAILIGVLPEFSSADSTTSTSRLSACRVQSQRWTQILRNTRFHTLKDALRLFVQRAKREALGNYPLAGFPLRNCGGLVPLLGAEL